MKKLKTVFMGTPDFSVPALDMLFHHPCIEIQAIVSMPDRPSGRGHNLRSPEVIEFAKQRKLPFIQTENVNLEKDFIKSIQECDIIIVLAFAQFIKEELLNLPKMGCFNIHTSLLPKYRGAAPIQYALLNGDASTGVSIQRMVKKMDAGDVCYLSPVKIHTNETGGQLYTRLKFQAALALSDFIYDLAENKIAFTKQNESAVSFAPTLKKEDGFLDFSKKSYTELKNQIRALDPWPGTYCFLSSKRMKVYSIEKSSEKLEPGKFVINNKALHIGCKGGALSLLEVQLEGKKRCHMSELLNGLRLDQIKLND